MLKSKYEDISIIFEYCCNIRIDQFIGYKTIRVKIGWTES